MSSAKRRLPPDMLQQTPHQRKMPLLFCPRHLTPHQTRATKVRRCWRLLQRPLEETSSHSRPTPSLGTGATSLVKHQLLSVYIQTSGVEGNEAFFLLLFFQVFSSHLRLLGCLHWFSWHGSFFRLLKRRGTANYRVCFKDYNREITQKYTLKRNV